MHLKSDLILCEDTRRSIKLLNHLNIKNLFLSINLTREKISLIIGYIKQGKFLSLISDAYPLLLIQAGL